MIPYRDLNPTRTTPWLTWALISFNVAVFFFEAAVFGGTSASFAPDWGFVPARFLADPLGEAPTLVTSMFLHGDWTHLASNMLFLWVFGDNVEDRLGRGRFALFYLLAGVAAAIGQTLVEPLSALPMIGASGAIAGVLGAYITLFPGARVRTIIPPFFFWPLELPAWVVIAGWFLLQVAHGLSSLALPASEVGVAFFAHIGGFVAGLWLVRRLLPPAPPAPPARVEQLDAWRPPPRYPDPRSVDPRYRAWRLRERDDDRWGLAPPGRRLRPGAGAW